MWHCHLWLSVADRHLLFSSEIIFVKLADRWQGLFLIHCKWIYLTQQEVASFKYSFMFSSMAGIVCFSNSSTGHCATGPSPSKCLRRCQRSSYTSSSTHACTVPSGYNGSSCPDAIQHRKLSLGVLCSWKARMGGEKEIKILRMYSFDRIVISNVEDMGIWRNKKEMWGNRVQMPSLHWNLYSIGVYS